MYFYFILINWATDASLLGVPFKEAPGKKMAASIKISHNYAPCKITILLTSPLQGPKSLVMYWTSYNAKALKKEKEKKKLPQNAEIQ